jgi:hypothetical protein
MANSFMVPYPPELTKGLPDPNMITTATTQGEGAVDADCNTKQDAIMQEAQIKKAMIEQTAKIKMAERQLQVEEAVKMQMMAIDKEAAAQVMMLEEQCITQKTMASETAAIAFAEQQKIKAMAEMAAKSRQVQATFMDQEARMMAEYQKARSAGMRNGVMTPAMPTAPGVPMPMPMPGVPPATAYAGVPPATAYAGMPPATAYAAPAAAMPTYAAPPAVVI